MLRDRPGTASAGVESGRCRRRPERLGRRRPGRRLCRGWRTGRPPRPGRISRLGRRLRWKRLFSRCLCWCRPRLRRPDRSHDVGDGCGWLRRRRPGRWRPSVGEGPGTGQGHDQVVELRLESVETPVYRCELSIGSCELSIRSRGLLLGPAVDVAAQVAEVGAQPPKSRAARRHQSGESNAQQRGEDFEFHGRYRTKPV